MLSREAVSMDRKASFDFKTTEEIEVPARLIDQVIGQDEAVDTIKLAAQQKRHVLLIGPPGTGKSMLAQAMAEILPIKELDDILVYPNPVMENEPLVKAVPTYPTREFFQKHIEFIRLYKKDELMKIFEGKLSVKDAVKYLKDGLGRRIVMYKAPTPLQNKPHISPMLYLGLFAVLGILLFFLPISEATRWYFTGLAFGLGILYLLYLFISLGGRAQAAMQQNQMKPKLIVDNTGKTRAPFIDATGAKAGALLGDVKHDPLQSGGLGTPAHLRVEAGAIHKANNGVLFIDEIASLKLNWQQELLTAMQEKKYSITGQSELSSGALVKTKPVPSDFVLVAAGNEEDLTKLHPALRSRIRGNGYEVYMNTVMDDTEENRAKLVQFVAQEVKKDGKIPHFTKAAVLQIIEEAKRMAGRKGKLTLNLRELGGLIRAAGDIARRENASYVEPSHIKKAKKKARPLEWQIADRYAERKKEYQVILTKGYKVGRVNGLAVLGSSNKGIALPIVAEVTPSASEVEGKIIATGKLGDIAKEAVQNISAVIKKALGANIAKNDIHIQFLQTYEGVEGDSASISIAVAVISAFTDVPIRQDVAMTGSLDVRGEVLPVGGVNAKIEAAIDLGLKEVIIPEKNAKDVSEALKKKIKVHTAKTIDEVLEVALKNSKKKKEIVKRFKRAER